MEDHVITNATPISDLTPAQARRQIAELRYGVQGEFSKDGRFFVHPDGMIVTPDWTSDPGAALALMTPNCALTNVTGEGWPGKWECSSPHPVQDGEYPRYLTRYADTPEMAICAWWLALAAKRTTD